AYENSDSFREFIESERVFLNPVLRWKLSERTQADFWVQYTHTDDPLDAGIPPLGSRPAPIPRERNLGEADSIFEFDDTRIGFDWSHAFNDRWTLRHTFESVFSHQALSPVALPISPPDPARCSAENCPVDRVFFDSPTTDADAYYTALNLTGKFDTWGFAHTLLLGGDYWRHQSSSTSRIVFSAPPIDLFNPVHTGIPSNVFDTPDSVEQAEGSEDWYGFYVQDQVKLPFDVHLLAGFRYDDARQSSNSSKSEDSAVTPRFGLLWQPIPALSLYGNYVENFGTANVFSLTASGTAPPPETAQQWEIGAKTELFDGRLSATLAWFDLTKQNIASPDPDPVRALAGFSVTTGEARNRGLEFDLAGELWPGVSAIASYAYI
ncbi:MAG: TonB-dependent siderophore receptor, partial [Gammaproteobacteria bacterium]